jgi:sugar phosphate isomerase/epimerase
MTRMPIARRNFLKRLALILGAIPHVLRVVGERLPIGFSTLGCPSWDWLKILAFAQQNGFVAVELRGLQGTVDLPARPEFADARMEQTKNEISSRALRIGCVSSSVNLHETGQQQEQQLADARRFTDLASRLSCPMSAFSATS